MLTSDVLALCRGQARRLGVEPGAFDPLGLAHHSNALARYLGIVVMHSSTPQGSMVTAVLRGEPIHDYGARRCIHSVFVADMPGNNRQEKRERAVNWAICYVAALHQLLFANSERT